jgi:hypothetical protein
MDRLLFRRVLPLHFCAAFFLTWSIRIDQVSHVSRVTPKIKSGIAPLEWFPEELNWSGFGMWLSTLTEDNCGALRDTDVHSLSHCSRSLSSLQAFDEQHWLMGRGYDSCFVRVESQIDMPGRQRHIVDIQTGYDGKIIPPWSTPAPMGQEVDVAVWKDASDVHLLR